LPHLDEGALVNAIAHMRIESALLKMPNSRSSRSFTKVDVRRLGEWPLHATSASRFLGNPPVDPLKVTWQRAFMAARS
jgi:hypothetical protein